MNRIDRPTGNQHAGTTSASLFNPARAVTGRAPRSGRDGKSSSLVMRALSVSLMLALAMQAHAAGPTGGVVTAGQGSIVNNGATTTITQSSANLIIDWQAFSIGAGDTVQFVQPGRSSVALNRVLGADPSVILGQLNANGNVFLLNPNGVLFGNGASVSVGGLVASTMSISNADFLAGHYALGNAGTGTGILALAGRRFGATEVLGIDNDPRAIAHALANARLNKIRGTKFQTVDFLRWKPPQRYEVITANLFSELLISALPLFQRALQRAGTLILSGILRAQGPEVLRALRRSGFDLTTQRRRGKWIALRAQSAKSKTQLKAR